MSTREEPTAWRVDAIRNYVFIEPQRQKNPPIQEVFRTKEAATTRKLELQAMGYVASVSPVHVKPGRKHRRAMQSAPFGDFRRGWTYHQFA